MKTRIPAPMGGGHALTDPHSTLPATLANISRVACAIFWCCVFALSLSSHAPAQVPPVDPPDFLTTDNSANWEPGQLLYRYVGIGRTAQAGYMNGNIYAGGYAGRAYRSWVWTDETDATSMVLDLDEDMGDEIDISGDQGTHGYHSRGGMLGGGIAYVSTGVNNAASAGSNPEPGYGAQGSRPIPSIADDDGQQYAYYPWALPFNWEMYAPTDGYAWIWRMDEFLGQWNARSETGVVGTTLLIGNLFFVISDQTNTGVAVYDIGPLFDEDPATGPVLLDKLSGAFGGYLNAVWENFLVLPTGNSNEWRLQIIDYSDPTNLRYVGDVVSEVTVYQAGKNYVQFQDNYGFFQGNKVNMDTLDVELVMHGLDTAARPAGPLPVDTPLNTSQYNLPIGNLLLTAGYGGTGDGIGLWVHQDAPDTTRPYVGYHVPRPNATNYPVGAPITLMIHETLELYTIEYGTTVNLKKASDGSLVDCHLSFSHDDLLMITPKQYLEDNTEYIVEIVDNGMKDSAGNGIEGYTFNFSTGNTVPNGNEPPEITGITITGSPGQAGDSITFDVAANDPEGAASLEYRYTFGDGTASTDWLTANSRSHTYNADGHFEAKIEVREAGDNASRSIELRTVTIADPVTGIQPTKSSPIALDSVNDRVWVVNPDNDSVTFFDSTNPAAAGSEILLKNISSYSGSFDPRSVAIDSSGNAWIACHDADRVIITNAGGALVGEIDMGYGSSPAAIAASPTGGNIYVTTQGGGATDRANGELIRYSASSMTETGNVELGPMAREIAVSSDESRVYVARFISGLVYGEVWEIDTTGSMSLANTIPLYMNPDAPSSANGPGIPNYVSSLTISPDGDWLWYTAKKDNIVGGQLLGENHQTDTTVRAMLGRIDLTGSTPSETVGYRIDFDNADSPTAVAFSARADWMFVTAQGNNLFGVYDILDIDANLGGLKHPNTRYRFETGLAPQGIVYDPDNDRIWTKDFMDRSVTIYEMSGFIATGAQPTSSSQLSVGSEALSASVLNGKQIFYNASDGDLGTNRMSDEGYMSCATCHVDGMHDGRTWDFTQRGEGLRNTTDLRGRAGLGHGNVHWTANFNEIHDFNLDIVNHFGGRGFPQDVELNEPLGAANANGDPDLDDLVAYITSLGTDTLPKSPHRNADGTMTDEAKNLGAALFNGTQTATAGFALNCASCHNPSTDYTDSVLGDGTDALHNTGSLRASSGTRLNGSLDGIDTPTLLGLWNAAPYMHNGAAGTLDDVFILGEMTEYEGEDATVSGPSANTTSSLGAIGGQVARLNDNGDVITFNNVDGGDGGLCRIEVRYGSRSVHDGSVEIEINGVAEPLPLQITSVSAQIYGYDVVVLERALNSGPTNTIKINKIGGATSQWINIDQLAVGTSATNDHRELLAVKNASQAEYDAVIAYLQQLDGRDMDGALPIGTGGNGVTVEIDPWSSADGFVFRVENSGSNAITQIDLEVAGGGQFDTFAPGSQFTVDPVFGSNNQAPKSVTATLNFSPALVPAGTDTSGAINNYNVGDIDGTFTGMNVTVHFEGGGTASGSMTNIGDTDDGNSELWQFQVVPSGGTTVLAVNDDGVTVDEGGSVTIDVLANDSGENLIISQVQQGTRGSVVNNTLDVSYTPNTWSGSDSFTYTVSNGLESSTATVNLTINTVNGSDPVPVATFPVALDFHADGENDRQNTTNDTWELTARSLGIDGTAIGEDSLYMLADDTVTGDFQALVQLVGLSGPDGSRMGLMIRDGDTVGAKFVAIGSDTGDGYTYQTRTTSGAAATAETVPSVGETHTFATGKWALLKRIGDDLTVAVSNDDQVYVEHATENLSGWSNTLHLGLYVSSGATDAAALAEFDNYVVGKPNLIENGNFSSGYVDTFLTPTTAATGGWYQNPNIGRPINIQNGTLGMSTGNTTPETIFQVISSGANGQATFEYDVLNARADFEWAIYGYNGTAATVDQALADDGFGTRNYLPSNPSGTVLATGFFDTAGPSQSVMLDLGTGYDYLVIAIHTPSAPGTASDLVDNLSLTADGTGGGTVVMAAATDDGPYAVDEGSSGNTLDVLDNDSGTGITITAVTGATYGTVTNNGSNLTYTPHAGVWGQTETFDYTIQADDNSTDTGTVTVNINATAGSTTVPAADFPVALDSAGYSANRVLDSNGHWQLVSDGTGFDTTESNDGIYMLADDSVTGNFQAYVQLVSLSGPTSSRMGLMLRDGSGFGAEFLAIGSDTGNGYKLQQRTDDTAGANTETAAAAGSGHTFSTGKWVLLQRDGDTVTVAVDEDNIGAYTQVTTVDVSGWSDTLHVGLFVHSGLAGSNAVAEFDNYTLLLSPPVALLNSDFSSGFTGWLGFYSPLTTSQAGQGWFENPNNARPLEISSGELILTDGSSKPEVIYQIINDAKTGQGPASLGMNVLTLDSNIVYAVYGYNGDTATVDTAMQNDGLYTRSTVPSNPANGTVLAYGNLGEFSATGPQSVAVDLGAGYDYLVIAIETTTSAPSGATVPVLDDVQWE